MIEPGFLERIFRHERTTFLLRASDISIVPHVSDFTSISNRVSYAG